MKLGTLITFQAMITLHPLTTQSYGCVLRLGRQDNLDGWRKMRVAHKKKALENLSGAILALWTPQ